MSFFCLAVDSSRTVRFVGTAIICLMLGVSGCGSSKPQPAAKSNPVTSTSAVNHGPGAAGSETAVNTAKEDDGTPDASTEETALAAVSKALKAVESGDLANAYDFLPPAYQSDVDGLLHEFATRMDAEVWTKLFATLRKTTEVLRTKKAMLLELDVIANRNDASAIRTHWDDAVAVVDQVVSSSVGDLVELRKLNVKALLPGTGSNVVKQLDALGLGVGADLARQFSGIKVTSVKTTGDGQILSFQSQRDEKPIEIEYVKHEGRWLPRSLIAQWAAGVKADREWLAKLPEQVKAAKPVVLDSLSHANELLDRMLAATTREEFQLAVAPAILSLTVAWPKIEQLSRQSVAGNVDSPPLTLIIHRELSEKEQDTFANSILKPLAEQGAEYTMFSNDGRTVCRLTRLSDKANLRDKLIQHFKVPVERVTFDEESSRVEVRFDEAQ